MVAQSGVRKIPPSIVWKWDTGCIATLWGCSASAYISVFAPFRVFSGRADRSDRIWQDFWLLSESEYDPCLKIRDLPRLCTRASLYLSVFELFSLPLSVSLLLYCVILDISRYFHPKSSLSCLQFWDISRSSVIPIFFHTNDKNSHPNHFESISDCIFLLDYRLRIISQIPPSCSHRYREIHSIICIWILCVSCSLSKDSPSEMMIRISLVHAIYEI